jgi:NAD(P)-dependent dehydrogenase (short-subunit alcohol dehydrogenase family)
VPDILITGGSDGIALAVAKLLAAPGDARATLVARSEAKLREAVARYAPIDSAAAARQPEEGDQHDGEEQPIRPGGRLQQ